MRTIDSLTLDEARSILNDIRAILYTDSTIIEDGAGDVEVLNGDKEWDDDTLDAIANTLDEWELRPPPYVERDLDSILDSYMECALRSSTYQTTEEGPDTPMDNDFGNDDIDEGTRAQMKADILSFLSMVNETGIDTEAWDDEKLGHDFWLTRNHHGAWFWDRGQGEEGDALTKIAHSFGSCDLYVGDDGKVHCE